MLKIVYPNCCGIDVHKTFVVACISITNYSGVTQYFTKRFSTFSKGLRDLNDWLDLYSCFDVCMESTGKYWIPVFNILESDRNICLAHPKYVKAIRGKKTDKKDAKWIADLFKHDLVASSFIPPLPIRELRDLYRYHFKLTNNMSSEANRLQNSLTVCNITLSSVLSDVFGKSGSNIIDAILDNPYEKIDLEPLIHGRLKSKLDDLYLAIDANLTETQALKIRIIKSHYDAIKLLKANLESAGKKHSTRTSKAGQYLKPLLVQIANAIVKSEKCPEHRNKYLQLRKCRGHKKTIIAVVRRLLVAIYQVLKKNEPYNAKLYNVESIKPDRTITIKEAINFAKSHGFIVS